MMAQASESGVVIGFGRVRTLGSEQVQHLRPLHCLDLNL